MSDSKNLKSLGSAKTTYKLDKPDKNILETFKNIHPGANYIVPFMQDRDEFTSLCPKTSQPDFAKMEILYVPNKLLVESKSLKLYFFSFRNSGEFHEDVCNRIAKDLIAVLKPKYLRVYGDFAPRGGLAIKPIVEYWEKGFNQEIAHLIQAWDLKK